MGKYAFAITLNRSKPAFIRSVAPMIDSSIDYLLQVKNCGEEIYDGYYSNKRNHGTTYVLIYNVKGTCSLKTSEGTQNIEEGQLFIINLKEYSLLKQTSTIWHNYWLCIYGTILDWIFSSFKNSDFIIKNIDPTDFKKLINYIIDCYDQNKYDINDISVRIYKFLLDLLKSKKSNNYSKETLSIIHFFESNFQNQINLNDLSKLYNFSKYYLIKKFSKETGYCPIDYLNNIRIKKAEILLENTNLTNEEIAIRCGFSDVRNLYYLFKKKKGVPPMVYRAEHKTFY